MSVFDASAVLAILFDEQGAADAAARLPGATMSVVNVAEVVGDFVRRGLPAAQAVEALDLLGLSYAAPDPRQAVIVGALHAIKGLSLGDRFCIALAQSLAVPVVTADQAWARMPIGAPVELIR